MFSIIIPVYNVESYLCECLDSVLSQTYTDYEVICINDGSTDGSRSILETYTQQHTKIKIIHQHNQGLSASRNRGIREAIGDYIFFLDSDDWIEPDALMILAEKENGEDLVCFNGRRYFENGTTEIPDKGINEFGLSGWEYYNKYSVVNRKFDFVCTVLRIYRKDFLLEHSLYFEEGIFHEDNLFTPIACYYANKVLIVSDVLYVYRIRSGSITQSGSNESVRIKKLHDIVKVANTLCAFFISRTDIDKKVIYKNINISILHLINMINDWKLNKYIDSVYSEINWHYLKRTIVGVDLYLLFSLAKNKNWKLFYKLYYFDFYICRKYTRKLKLKLKY